MIKPHIIFNINVIRYNIINRSIKVEFTLINVSSIAYSIWTIRNKDLDMECVSLGRLDGDEMEDEMEDE